MVPDHDRFMALEIEVSLALDIDLWLWNTPCVFLDKHPNSMRQSCLDFHPCLQVSGSGLRVRGSEPNSSGASTPPDLSFFLNQDPHWDLSHLVVLKARSDRTCIKR